MLPVAKKTKFENFMYEIYNIFDIINIIISINKYRILFITIMSLVFTIKCIKNSLFHEYACMRYNIGTTILLFLDTFTDLIFGYHSVKLYNKTIKSI
jgi:hypothetical protein